MTPLPRQHKPRRYKKVCREDRAGFKRRSNNTWREERKATGLRFAQQLGAGTGWGSWVWVPVGTKGGSIWVSLSASPDAGRRLKCCQQSNVKNWSQTLHYECVQTFPNNLYRAQGEDFGRLVHVSYVAMFRNLSLHLDIYSMKGSKCIYSCLISFGLFFKKKTNKYCQN